MDAAHSSEEKKNLSPGQLAWKRLRRNKRAMFSLYFLTVIALACIAGPWLSPYLYEEQDIAYKAQPPSAKHWMGTDSLGRDLLTRTLHGGRISLAVGIVATLVALVIGVAYGGIAGYAGGKTDALMMRFVDVLYALPFMVFVILLMVLFGRNLLLIFVAIGAVEWLTMARIVRGQVRYLKGKPFVEASLALGAGSGRVLLRHLLPNVLGIVVVYATLTVPSVMLLEAVLSFLGLGVQAPLSSWGSLIGDGAMAMENTPWRLFFPALFFSLTLFSLNFLGDGLRDAFDSRDAAD